MDKENRESANNLCQRALALSPDIYKIICSIVRDSHDSEDIQQDAIILALTKSESYAPSRGSIDVWLKTLAANRARDYLRYRKTRSKILVNSLDIDYCIIRDTRAKEPYEIAQLSESRERIRDYLARISDEQRTLLEDHYYNGQTTIEISRRLNVPQRTIKSRIHKAKEMLHQAFLDEFA
ncbi:MAG: RNA polymerase sigma factor [Nanoarchaeota archaeon]